VVAESAFVEGSLRVCHAHISTVCLSFVVLRRSQTTLSSVTKVDVVVLEPEVRCLVLDVHCRGCLFLHQIVAATKDYWAAEGSCKIVSVLQSVLMHH